MLGHGETVLMDAALSVLPTLWVAWAAWTAKLYCKGTTPWAGGRQGGYPDPPALMVEVQEDLHR